MNIVDATNLERNLYLTVQLLEMKVPVLVVLNMMDLAAKKGIAIDIPRLSKALGCPVIGISALLKTDIERVKEAISSRLNEAEVSQIRIEYPAEIEKVLTAWAPKLGNIAHFHGADERWVGTKLLEEDAWMIRMVSGVLEQSEIETAVASLHKSLREYPDVIMADCRYGFINTIVRQVMTMKKRTSADVSDKIDKVLMHRVLGIPIFLVVMYLVFWITINVGGAFIDFFDIFFGTIFVDGFGRLLETIGSPPWLVTILAGGVGAGIKTVSTFVPLIFVMFFLISLLEDSGYMARAAFVMDRFMRWIGLPGKSFIPMILGFGCTIPGVMATRTLDSKKDRFLTVFMTPFMSCGARLPVYALFAAAFFPGNPGLMVFSLYVAGIVLALLTGILLKYTLFKGEASAFVMELPSYHAPRFGQAVGHGWDRLKIFIRRAGLVITAVVVILGFLNSWGVDGSFGNENAEESVLSAVGKTITPVFEPMGIEKENWPATVSLFTGLFAKEAVVGTLNGLYGQIGLPEGRGNVIAAEGSDLEGGAETSQADAEPAPAEEAGDAFDFWGGIGEAFASIPAGLAGIFGGLADPIGAGIVSGDEAAVAEEVEADEGLFTAMRSYFSLGPNQVYAYLLFILIYFPCVAALGAIIREIGLAYGWLSIGYLTVLAWIVATLYYQITIGHQALWIVVPVLGIGLIIALFTLIGRQSKRFPKGVD